MIDLQKFTEAFEDLNGAFDKLPKKNTSIVWFKEMARWDDATFDAVFKKLMDAETFPRLRDAVNAKRIVERELNPWVADIPAKINSCEWCDEGVVMYLRLDDADRPIGEYRAACAYCRNPHLEGLQEVDGKRLAENPKIKLHRNHALIRDLRAKNLDPYQPLSLKVSMAQAASLRRLAPFGGEDAETERERAKHNSTIENRAGDIPF